MLKEVNYEELYALLFTVSAAVYVLTYTLPLDE